LIDCTDEGQPEFGICFFMDDVGHIHCFGSMVRGGIVQTGIGVWIGDIDIF